MKRKNKKNSSASVNCLSSEKGIQMVSKLPNRIYHTIKETIRIRFLPTITLLLTYPVRACTVVRNSVILKTLGVLSVMTDVGKRSKCDSVTLKASIKEIFWERMDRTLRHPPTAIMKLVVLAVCLLIVAASGESSFGFILTDLPLVYLRD